jgi:hypothetical protein
MKCCVALAILAVLIAVIGCGDARTPIHRDKDKPKPVLTEN